MPITKHRFVTILAVASVFSGLNGCIIIDENWVNSFTSHHTQAQTKRPTAIYIDTKTGNIETHQNLLPGASNTLIDQKHDEKLSVKQSNIQEKKVLDKTSVKVKEPTSSTAKRPAQRIIPISTNELGPLKPVFKTDGNWVANPKKHNSLKKLLLAWALQAGWKLHWGEGELDNTDFGYSTPFKLKGDFQTVVKQTLASRNLDPQLVPHFYTTNKQLVIRPNKGVKN